MKVFSTSEAGSERGVNILLYGRAGVGKTCALAMCPKPIILSVESGLLSLQGKVDVPYIPISSISELRDAYVWLKDNSAYSTICLDSVSEICDLAFIDAKNAVGNDPAKLYPELRNRILPLLRAFRSLPGKHLVATAREAAKVLKRETLVGPAVVGSKLTDDMPYIFDTVLHYTVDSEDNRVVLTNNDGGTIAKDRSGKLPPVIPVEFDERFSFLGKLINFLVGDTDGESDASEN